MSRRTLAPDARDQLGRRLRLCLLYRGVLRMLCRAHNRDPEGSSRMALRTMAQLDDIRLLYLKSRRARARVQRLDDALGSCVINPRWWPQQREWRQQDGHNERALSEVDAGGRRQAG